eukprot:scaffold4356_cov99-Isochrysis_galbana.AAC.1
MMASMMAVGTQVALGGMWRAGESRVKRSAAAQAPPPPQTADGRGAYACDLRFHTADAREASPVDAQMPMPMQNIMHV